MGGDENQHDRNGLSIDDFDPPKTSLGGFSGNALLEGLEWIGPMQLSSWVVGPRPLKGSTHPLVHAISQGDERS